MATYDSAKTRRVAREMTQLRQTLEMDVDAGLRGALPLIAELRGKTAQAMEEALGKAYQAVEKIRWQGVHYRKDIGRTK